MPTVIDLMRRIDEPQKQRTVINRVKRLQVKSACKKIGITGGSQCF